MGLPLIGTRVDGRIEAVDDGIVVGWAWRKGDAEPVEVEVLVEGETVATVTAKTKRGGLRRAGIGNGRHGFRVPLPEELAADGERRLEVVVLPDRVPLIGAAGYAGASRSGAWSRTRFVLSGAAPEPTEPEAPPPAALETDAPAPPQRDIPGVVESVADGFVSGWAVERVETVRAIADGSVVAETTPDLSRPDLEAGRAGFRLELPDALRGPGRHTLSVEADGTPLVATAECLRPAVAPVGEWAVADLRLALLDYAAHAEETPRTLLGPDAWRFEESGDRGGRELDDAEIERLAAKLLGWRAEHRSIRVLHVLAVLPARERLEREHMPVALRDRPRNTNVERLRAQMASKSPDGFLDLYPVLEEARGVRPVSLRTGAGLTAWGAAAAAAAMLSEAAARVPDLTAPDLERLPLMPVRGYRGDLAGRTAAMAEGSLSVELPPSAVPPDALAEEAELLAPEVLSALRAPASAHLAELAEERAAAVFECEGAPDRRICLLGTDLPPVFTALVAEQVSRCVVINRPGPPIDVIELELPHAVLHLLHERDLPALADDA